MFSSFYPERTKTTEEVIKLAKLGIIELYAPQLGEIEFIAVLSRYLDHDQVEQALRFYSALVTWIPEELLIEDLKEVAFKTYHKASDIYFIATASYLNGILITNDNKMAELAKSSGIQSFCLVKESEKFSGRWWDDSYHG
nr:type II toxin-antitoxin system VapC family toxin [Thermococcus chitonophagus]